jgi:hypothetical protein
MTMCVSTRSSDIGSSRTGGRSDASQRFDSAAVTADSG